MRDEELFSERRIETAISRALRQESFLAQSLLNGGMTAIRRLSFQDQGRALEGFFELANGVERLGKLVFVSDQYARTGAFPAPRQIRNFSHNLASLMNQIEAIAEERGVDRSDAPSKDDSSRAIVDFLSRFAETDRYFNLNRLGQRDSNTLDDPLTRWVALVTEFASAPRKTRTVEIEHRAAADFLDTNASIVIDFTSTQGGSINSLGAATTQIYTDDWVGVQGVLLAVRPLRFLARTIGRLNNAREPLPYYSEIFRDWLAPDSVLRRRRGFPRGRN